MQVLAAPLAEKVDINIFTLDTCSYMKELTSCWI